MTDIWFGDPRPLRAGRAAPRSGETESAVPRLGPDDPLIGDELHVKGSRIRGESEDPVAGLPDIRVFEISAFKHDGDPVSVDATKRLECSSALMPQIDNGDQPFFDIRTRERGPEYELAASVTNLIALAITAGQRALHRSTQVKGRLAGRDRRFSRDRYAQTNQNANHRRGNHAPGSPRAKWCSH